MRRSGGSSEETRRPVQVPDGFPADTYSSDSNPDSYPPDNCPEELCARRGHSIFYRGRTLLSRIDPVAQGERLAAEIPVKERTLYFCPSPLYGYGLRLLIGKLQNELPQNNSAVLCVEADDRLFKISDNAFGGLSAAGEQLTSGERLDAFEHADGNFPLIALIRTASAETLCGFVRKTWGERRFRRVEVIHLTGGWQLFQQVYDDLAGALRREMEVEWGNAMTLIRLGRLYARNLIRNLPLLPESERIGTLDFGSSPVLVLGAGPSLDPLLDELSARLGGSVPEPGKRSFGIVCVDTCIPALHERSILPDIVVILESQHWNLRDFTGARDRKINMAADLSSLPDSIKVLEGRRYFFATPWTKLALFNRLDKAGLLPGTFAPLGSVGLSAVAVSLRITTGPVLAGGLDFSYTLDTYHARSTPGQRDLLRRQNRFSGIINAGA
ncbi:MAG: DUF115 domain-containing protein, partial [Treponema sp.]|nr:DUF115 domain-containing protein [Treponema sp.]